MKNAPKDPKSVSLPKKDLFPSIETICLDDELELENFRLAKFDFAGGKASRVSFERALFEQRFCA